MLPGWYFNGNHGLSLAVDSSMRVSVTSIPEFCIIMCQLSRANNIEPVKISRFDLDKDHIPYGNHPVTTEMWVDALTERIQCIMICFSRLTACVQAGHS